MSEITKVEPISRREAFSFLGLTAALGFAARMTLLAGSDAEAQAPAPSPTTTPAPAGGTLGMQRRHARRAARHERRASGALLDMSARGAARRQRSHTTQVV